MNGAATLRVMDEIVRFLCQRTGMAYLARHRDTTESAVRQAMAELGILDLEHYRARVATDARAFEALIDRLTVRETYFFRDPQHFRFLRDTALPALRQARPPDHVLTLWSAGCATGEEPYSLAILLDEMGLSSRARVYGTDISRAGLKTARAASYGDWSLSRARFDGFERHFERRGGAFVLGPRIQERVTFEHHNLLGELMPSFAAERGAVDVIVCRNVMIYLGPDAVRRVAERFYEALSDGGWLIAGPSDPSLASHAPFEVVATDAGLLYRRSAERTAAASSMPAPPLEELPPPVDELGPPLELLPSSLDELPPSIDERVSPVDEPAGPRALSPTSSGRCTTMTPSPAMAGEGPTSGAPRPSVRSLMRSLEQGEYTRLVDLRGALLEDPETSALLVRATANRDGSERALEVAKDALLRHPLAPALHHLHALLFSSLGRFDEAARAAGRALFLDSRLAMTHFVLGSVLHRQGDLGGAARAYRNARDLCRALDDDAFVELSDGEPARALAEAAEAQLRLVERARRSGT